MMNIRIAMTGPEFKKLVAGDVVTRTIPVLKDGEKITVEFALNDLGFDVIKAAVCDARDADWAKKR